MTTLELLQRYPPHNDSSHQGKTSDETKVFEGKKPDLTVPNPNPSQYLDAKTKYLHEILDRAVKDLAKSQPEPVSKWEGTFWRSPSEPKPRSPTYSDISDSYESPDKIEHCTNDLLSTPMTKMSTLNKGPEGWPLGIEVAMNDFHTGRLSTPVLQEKMLPNPLILRKKKKQMSGPGGNGNQGGQKNASRESVPSPQHGDDQHQEQSGTLKSLAFEEQQSSAHFQQEGEKQGDLDSPSFSPPTLQQQSYTRPQQLSGCQYQREEVDVDPPELQQQNEQQNDEVINLETDCIPTLFPRRYGDDQKSFGNASSELLPALAHGKVPIGLALENPGLQLDTSQIHSEEGDWSQTQIDGRLLHQGSPQTTLSEPAAPRNEVIHEDARQAEQRINAFADSLGDGGIAFWKTSGPLQDILEESEDPLTSTLTLGRGPPQHFTPASAKPHNLKNPSGVRGKRDNMLALQGAQTESSTLSSSPPRVPPPMELTINATSKPRFESTIQSTHRPVDAQSAGSALSAATMAELKDPTRKKGRLSAAALVEMRKTAQSQEHFQTGPEDQSQASIHPLLRSKPLSRPSFQPSKMVNNSPLKYVFKDDDSDGQESEEGENVTPQITTKPHPLSQAEDSDAESFTTQVTVKRHPSFQLGKTVEKTVPTHLCNHDDMEGHEAENVGTSTSQMSNFRSSNDTTLAPSLENFLLSTSSSRTNRLSSSATGPPDADTTLPVSFLPPTSLLATGYYPTSRIGSPAAYNSWASTPHQGNLCSTPSSAATLPTSTVPTPNAPLDSISPTSRPVTMTPSSSFGQCAGNLPTSRMIPMTPSSSFGDFTSNRTHRRSVSVSSMFARYHKARYPDLPTAAMTDSIPSSKESTEKYLASEVTNDPFTSTSDTTTPFSLNLKAPTKEDLADTLTTGVDHLNTPTKRSPGRFSLHRRSLSFSGGPKIKEGIERTLSTMIFDPHRSRLHKRSHSTSASIDTTAKPDDSIPEDRRSLSIATTPVGQKWEIAPPPTPLGLRDTFSVRYRPEPLEADDHYSPSKDAGQGMKQGLKKVFSRK